MRGFLGLDGGLVVTGDKGVVKKDLNNEAIFGSNWCEVIERSSRGLIQTMSNFRAKEQLFGRVLVSR